MELRVIIIDDETDGIRGLKLLIEKYLQQVTIIAETTRPEEGIRFINNYRPDVVFLDIQMPGMDGLTLAEKVEFKDFKLIYTTAYEQYALNALKLGAADYLLKPVDAEELQETIERLRTRIKNQHSGIQLSQEMQLLMAREIKPSRIQLSDKDGSVICETDDIVRLEARSNYTWVVFKDKRGMLVSKTLKEFERQLCDGVGPFIRIHQSNIINLNHCLRYKKENGGLVEMKDESQINVSPTKKEEFLRRINSFNES